MFEQLKSFYRLMGQGLANQHLGEMSPTAEKIAQIEKSSQNYQLSGGQGRIVLIASMDPAGPALDFVIELAMQTKSLIEVLYIKPDNESKRQFNALLNRLGDHDCDFQITFLTGNLEERMCAYGSQRQDVLAMVCSATEVINEKLRFASQTLDPKLCTCFPVFFLVGASILA